MRTKTLLLTAALGAAGIATSMAQAPVYSVNAVGYVNTPLSPGYSLVSNPLNNKSAGGNTIQNLFGTGIQGTIPDGLVIYYYNPGAGFDFVQWESLDNAFSPAAKALTPILPGNGVFVKNPTLTTLTNTFVGEVPTGNLAHTIPAGFSIQASEVPQEGAADATLSLPRPTTADQLYFFNPATQGYAAPHIYDPEFGEWSPSLSTRPVKVGEAFFYQNRGTAKAWTRSFTIGG